MTKSALIQFRADGASSRSDLRGMRDALSLPFDDRSIDVVMCPRFCITQRSRDDGYCAR